jgi:2-phospho-L-lactate guanylyltransferase
MQAPTANCYIIYNKDKLFGRAVMAHALIPLKCLTEAKTRLAGLLRSSDRQALALAMAEDVLAVLSAHKDIDSITVVSDDPVAPLLASRHGAGCWQERKLGCTGLNPVIAAASQRLLQEGQPVVVLHADLPLLSKQDISAALACHREHSALVIGCDDAGLGTNLLVFDSASRPAFSFGEDSCARHFAWATDNAVPVQRLHRPGIALDVDSPLDVHTLITSMPPNAISSTATFLRRGPGRRVKAALASLPPLVPAPLPERLLHSYA